MIGRRASRIISQHRSSWAGEMAPISRCQCEGLLHDHRDAADVINEKTLLGDWSCDRNNIHFLKSILAKQVGGNVAGNCDNRNRITVSVSDAGHEVRGSRTRGRQTNAYSPGGACEPFGSMGRALFVLDADAADPAILQ